MADLTTSNPSQFIFPVLRNSEILQCMAELGIELTKSELLEPNRHKDRVRMVFLQLLEVCCGLCEEDFIPARCLPSNTEHLSYPELHEDAFSELKFFKEVRGCMEICGLHDFGLKDLHAPTAKRFKWQLSGAINMAKFREDQLKLYGEISESRVGLVQNLAEVTLENEEVNRHLEATEIDSNHKSQEIVELLEECAALEMEIKRNNKLQKEKREESTVLKKKANGLIDDIATTSLALEEAQAEEKTLLTKVVSSPERRKKDLEYQREVLDRERKDCAAVEEKLTLTKTKIANAAQAEQDCRTAIIIAGEVQEKHLEHSKVTEQVRAAVEILEANETETSKVLVQKEDCERTLHRTEEKIAHFRKQSKMKMNAAQEALESAQLQLLDVEKDRMDGMARVEAGEAEVRAMEAKIEEETKRTNQEIAEMVAEYRKTEKAILEQEAQFMAAIGSS